MNLVTLFLIIGLMLVMCPTTKELSTVQLATKINPENAMVYMHGRYYDAKEILKTHLLAGRPGSDSLFWRNNVLGHDVGHLFPRQQYWSQYCPGFPNNNSTFQLLPGNATLAALSTHLSIDIFQSRELQDLNKGWVVWHLSTIQDKIKQNSNLTKLFITYDRVYDVSSSFPVSSNTSSFMGKVVGDIISEPELSRGSDITSKFEALKRSDPVLWRNTMQCIDNMFFVGLVDHRDDMKCTATGIFMFSISVILVALIALKFFAALQFTSAKPPIEQDKFVFCLVTCYTEGELSLRKTIDSIALLDYDDKKRLLFVACDGMIIGSGNERSTPRIVLDILGVDPNLEVPTVCYEALGVGSKMLNYAKVYSGMYITGCRATPYIVLIKVGKPSERQRPGNR